jgi:hypothetical protein
VVVVPILVRAVSIEPKSVDDRWVVLSHEVFEEGAAVVDSEGLGDAAPLIREVGVVSPLFSFLSSCSAWDEFDEAA